MKTIALNGEAMDVGAERVRAWAAKMSGSVWGRVDDILSQKGGRRTGVNCSSHFLKLISITSLSSCIGMPCPNSSTVILNP